MQRFRLLPHSVTSDVAFEATGKTESELFANCATALFSVMCDVKRVKPKMTKNIELRTKNLEDLLFDFLNELIFLKDRDSMLFSKFEVNISTLYPSSGAKRSREVQDDSSRQARTIGITAKISGERIDPARHNLGVDVKAVTKHNFSVKKVDNRYKATVVLDI